MPRFLTEDEDEEEGLEEEKEEMYSVGGGGNLIKRECLEYGMWPQVRAGTTVVYLQ